MAILPVAIPLYPCSSSVLAKIGKSPPIAGNSLVLSVRRVEPFIEVLLVFGIFLFSVDARGCIALTFLLHPGEEVSKIALCQFFLKSGAGSLNKVSLIDCKTDHLTNSVILSDRPGDVL